MPEPMLFRIHIEAPVDDVWAEITKTEGQIPAFFNACMDVRELVPGAKLAMRTADGKYTSVVGEVLEFVPKKRFKHTFRFTAYDDPACIVTYELEPKDGGTEFTLTVDDAPAGTKTEKNMAQGGKMIINTLKATVETGKPTFGVRVLFGLFKVLQPISPKRCKSEHWPL